MKAPKENVMLPTKVPRDNGVVQRVVCTRCPQPALVRHLDHGWLCVDCAAAEGFPLAVQLKTEDAILRGLTILYPNGQPSTVARFADQLWRKHVKHSNELL